MTAASAVLELEVLAIPDVSKEFPFDSGVALIQGLAHNFIITAFALARPALGLVVNLADWSALN